jgi:hypothetical protein
VQEPSIRSSKATASGMAPCPAVPSMCVVLRQCEAATGEGPATGDGTERKGGSQWAGAGSTGDGAGVQGVDTIFGKTGQKEIRKRSR